MHHTVYDHHSNKTSIHIHQRWYLSTGLQHNVSNESCAIIVKHFLKVAVADNNGSMDVEGFDGKKKNHFMQEIRRGNIAPTMMSLLICWPPSPSITTFQSSNAAALAIYAFISQWSFVGKMLRVREADLTIRHPSIYSISWIASIHNCEVLHVVQGC